uniref:Uncharacterized protein n=1 Tax=Cardioderma bat coronavirus TaxID=3119326 RepID=A0AB38ZDI9_9NIDO
MLFSVHEVAGALEESKDMVLPDIHRFYFR